MIDIDTAHVQRCADMVPAWKLAMDDLRASGKLESILEREGESRTPMSLLHWVGAIVAGVPHAVESRKLPRDGEVVWREYVRIPAGIIQHRNDLACARRDSFPNSFAKCSPERRLGEGFRWRTLKMTILCTLIHLVRDELGDGMNPSSLREFTREFHGFVANLDYEQAEHFDPAAYLIFADWLEEKGAPAECVEAIRSWSQWSPAWRSPS